MNREEIEKHNKELNKILIKIRNHDIDIHDINKKVKDFIFDTVIKEVLESIIDIQTEVSTSRYVECRRAIDAVNDIKKKAKELYGINL